MKWKKLISAGHRLPLFMTLILEGFTFKQRYLIGCCLDSVFLAAKAGVIILYSTEESIERYKQQVHRLIEEDSQFIPRVIRRMQQDYGELVRFSESLNQINFPTQTNAELNELFQTFCLKFKQALATYAFPFFGDKVLSVLLIDRLTVLNSLEPDQLQEHAALLAMPMKQSDYKHEYLHFLKLITYDYSNIVE